MSIIAIVFLFVMVFWLSWSNGANDNFKGVATLYGSGTTTFRQSVIWATISTALGSLASIYLAGTLARQFSGAGIISGVSIDATWLMAVGAAGAITIWLATVLGMPTSTTHALTGALIGTGIVANPAGIQWAIVWNKFTQPLLLSPLAGIGLAAMLYILFRKTRLSLGIQRQTCVCIGKSAPQPVVLQADGSAVMARSNGGHVSVEIGPADRCIERYQGNVIGIEAQKAVDAVHYLSSGAVCFARAVNDTPKIAALLLVSGAAIGSMPSGVPMAVVMLAMTMGGLVQARRVAETMSRNITMMNPGQGLTANLVTSALVLVASRMGMPVSTTHVSCGAIFGIGLASRSVQWKTVAKIGVTWMTTLPAGAVLGGGLYWFLTTIL